MTTKDPYGIGRAIKPWHMKEPITEQIHTCDPPEIIAICLDCPVKGGCYPELSVCPLNGRNKELTEVTPREVKSNKKHIQRLERDEKLLYLITHGWRNTECICEELGIGKAALSAAKKRLRERGAIL